MPGWRTAAYRRQAGFDQACHGRSGRRTGRAGLPRAGQTPVAESASDGSAAVAPIDDIWSAEAQLLELRELRSRGLVTDAEFERHQARILGE
jgi:hypothetical protein